jgi:hypothetical protein
MPRVFGRNRPGGGFDQAKLKDSHRMHLDGSDRIQATGLAFGPGGQQVSRPRPRLRPGCGGEQSTALGRVEVGRELRCWSAGRTCPSGPRAALMLGRKERCARAGPRAAECTAWLRAGLRAKFCDE